MFAWLSYRLALPVNNNQIAVILIWTDCESARGCCCLTRGVACYSSRPPAGEEAAGRKKDGAGPHLEWRRYRLGYIVYFKLNQFAYLTWCAMKARTPASFWSDWRAHSGPRYRLAGTGTTACNGRERSARHWTSRPNPTYHDKSTLFWFCCKEYDCYTLNDFGEGNCALGNESLSCIVLPCHAIWYLSQDSLHHGQVLAIVVRLEERDPQIEFEQDATVEEININTKAHSGIS